MKTNFELIFYIDEKELEKEEIEIKGDNADVLRESLITALEKCKLNFQEKIIQQMNKRKK